MVISCSDTQIFGNPSRKPPSSIQFSPTFSPPAVCWPGNHQRDYFFRTGRVVEIDDHQNRAKITVESGGDEREFTLLGIFVQPESMNAAVGRDIGFEETGFARLGRIGDIEKSNAAMSRF